MERVSDERMKELIEVCESEPKSNLARMQLSIFRELQELRAQSRWVKVEDRLPEDSSSVIVALGGVLKTVAHYNHRKKLWRPGNRPNGELVGVTHWREFPAPPEEDKVNG